MKIPLRILVSVLITLTGQVSAQDLGNLKSVRPIDFSGAFSLRLNSYSTNRDNAVRDPFFWTVTGTPTVSLYGVTLPFYFAFSQKQTDYRQPFNQFGLSPHYKWLRLHLGYRNISFSDFTLANHTFMGVGIEAEPSIFRLGFIYGRFLKAIDQPRDTLSGEIITPTFARRGVAAKIGIGTHNNFVDLIFFKGKDDSTSVSTGWETLGLRPAENLVYGIKARQGFLKIFMLDIDYGFSVYTSDITSPIVSAEEYKVPFFVTAFLTPRASTSFQMAGKASLAMRLKMLSLRLQYTRVEPDYQSMGSYFLNNDYENITIAPSWSMLKNKIRVSGSVGFQKNNLFEDKISSTNRRINSVNVNLMPNPRFNVTAFYTNYRINQERNVRLTLDTLRLEQFSDNLNVMAMLTRGSKEIRHNFTGGVNYQVLRDDNNISETNNSTTSLNPSLGYRYQNTVNHFGANVNITMNRFITDVSETIRLGYTVGGNKSLLDNQLRLNASATYFNVKTAGAASSNALSINGRIGYSIKDKHTLDLSASLVSRTIAGSDEPGIHDILANFGYTYNFSRKQ
jgi:hypothetical protein